jgi:hypothetical protein
MVHARHQPALLTFVLRELAEAANAGGEQVAGTNEEAISATSSILLATTFWQ